MSDMQIAIWFRWKTGLYMVINAFCQVLIDFLLYKVLRNQLFFFGFYYNVFLCHNCSSVICRHSYLK